MATIGVTTSSDAIESKAAPRRSARPQRAQNVIEPAAADRRHDLSGGLLEVEFMSHDLAEPRPVRIRHERLNARDIAGEGFDEGGHLASEEREHDEAERDEAEDQQQDDGQGGEGSIDPEPFECADD